MKKTSLRWTAQTFLLLAMSVGTIHAPAQTNVAFQMAGTVTRPDDGCNQAVVVLCDQASGEPLCRQNLQPFTSVMGTTNEQFAMDWLQAIPDATGHFEFNNLPAGNYIVVAQAWPGSSQPTNILNFRGETVHLLGRAEIAVPSAAARQVKFIAPGTNTIQFDQQFPNDDGFLMLGTQPPRGDPVLAWLGWGTNFIRHLIGCNAMPRGRTAVHGLPAETYAAIFMNDDSPGFGAMRLPFRAPNPVKLPLVAGWSDGYKTPPTNLVWLVEWLQTHKFKIDELLGISAKPKARATFFEKECEQARLVLPIWEKEIVLPTGQKTRVVDLLTALGYARLSGKYKN